MKKNLLILIREENFLSLMGNLVIALLGIIGFSLLARNMEKAVFGQWILFVAAGSFIEMFRFGITNTGLIRFLAGADPELRTKFLGSNALLGLCSTVLVALLILVIGLAFPQAMERSGYGLFFKWYPLLAFFNLPWNTALLIFQADRRYDRILILKGFYSGVFFCIILGNGRFYTLSLEQLIYCLLAVNAATSFICFLMGWDGLSQIRNADRLTNRKLLDFGKYTTFTLAGTNLLRSADTIIISLSPWGSAAVALYSIPLKLTELQQIPLRSFAATAFPKMSKASMQGDTQLVKKIFNTYAGALSFLFVAMSLFTFLFADTIVWIVAGKQYLVTDPLTGFNAAGIVRIFSIYGLLLPIDRMTGIGLDSINKPHANAIKVFIMVIANILGDVIAVFLFKSLVLVAIGSIVFTLIGIFTGFYFLTKELNLSFRNIFISGLDFYQSIFLKMTGRSFTITAKSR